MSISDTMNAMDLDSIHVEVLEKNVDNWPAAKIRSTFIKFFTEKHGHTVWPSSPVVPVNDPTLLFANAGMNQFKSIFQGTVDPSSPLAALSRAVNSQKCIRAGGKHNDLEDVGKDTYHHTFFEMLGNWSFGAYFKETAIRYAWECLTVEFQMDGSRLYATYFGGDEAQGLLPDLEARDFWLRYLPAERVIPCGCKENFWEMGATGPCGPCSEVHYDRIGNRDARLMVNADLPDVIEIWNVVFIQYNREADNSLRELPSKHVDTGMGFERLASIMQGKDSNYDTDIFTPIFSAIQSVTGAPAYEGKLGITDVGLVDMAYRVIGDHIRTLTFAIADGAVPSSEGRGYVLRRILRRAVRYGQEMLNAPAGFFTKLVPVVVENFGDMFPELRSRQSYVESIVADEESSFGRTLEQGVRHFTKVVSALEKGGEGGTVSGKDAHFLFSTMGFPLDLTQLMAQERGLEVDSAGFDLLMERDRQISEKAELARKGGGSKDLSMEAEQTAHLANQGLAPTDSESKYLWDVAPSATVLAVFQGRGGVGAGFSEGCSAEDGTVGLVLSNTSFYYESGGQVYDTGVLRVEGNQGTEECAFSVANAQTYAGYVVHVGSVVSGSGIKVGDTVSVQVDYERRAYVAPNHTMTHVLNYALRSVLVNGVTTSDLPTPECFPTAPIVTGLSQCDQKGSLVDADKMRFDFSWAGPLTVPQLSLVQDIVNNRIRASLPVHSATVPLAQASQILALRQVFGERYPDPVRVISVGQSIEALLSEPANPFWSCFSVEFCGGTHLTNTAQAADFVIVEEAGTAKGIRRIVGLTRKAAREARSLALDLLQRIDVAQTLPGGPALSQAYKGLKLSVDGAVVSLVDKDSMRTRLAGLYETMKAYFKANQASKVLEATSLAQQAAEAAAASNQAVLVLAVEVGADGKVAKKLIEGMRAISPQTSFLLASLDDDREKVGVYPAVSAVHLAGGLSAKDWVTHLIDKAGRGKGGGKADMANATLPVEQEAGEGAEGGADADAFLAQLLLWGGEFAEGKVGK
mmetsp:Transcript_14718/g.32206  ORF Transcript_14718/g.32206 Transcript_14718/m.32206 type:complete len:1030 (-) Transcript_14718:4-3093(-)